MLYTGEELIEKLRWDKTLGSMFDEKGNIINEKHVDATRIYEVEKDQANSKDECVSYKVKIV